MNGDFHAVRESRPLGLKLLAWAAAGLLLCGCASGRLRQAKEAPGAPLAQETFEAVWTLIHETHYDTNFNGVDWAAVKKEFQPKVSRCQTTSQLRQVLEEMLDRLGDSHMGIIPGELDEVTSSKASNIKPKRKGRTKETKETEVVSTAPSKGGEANPGLEIRLIDGQILVTRVAPGSSGAEAGVKPGWALLEANEVAIATLVDQLKKEKEERRRQFLGWLLAQQQLGGAPGSMVRLKFWTGENQEKELQLERRLEEGEVTKLGHLPELRSFLESDWAASEAGLQAGYIRFNIWMLPIGPAFDEAIDRFRQADGIIVDLRGNIGGMAAMVMGIAGHFLDERVSLGAMKMRDGELRIIANPRRVSRSGKRVTPYAGSLAILTDPISISAAELFAGGMQSLGRARVFGGVTAGQALPAMFDKLPNGDVLYHAFADFQTPDGKRLEGQGVRPDEPVATTRTDLLAGRDRPLLAALDWIQKQKARASQSSASVSNLSPK